MIYLVPQIAVIEVDLVLLIGSGPNAGDIGSPSVRTKSVWDEVENTYNINKEEQGYEDWE